MFDHFIDQYPTITVFVCLILVFSVFFAYKYRLRVYISKKLDGTHEKRNSDMDIIMKMLGEISDKVDGIRADVDKLKQHEEDREYKRELRGAIDRATEAIIENCQNNKFNQLAVDGADHFFEFAEWIYTSGFTNFNAKRARFKAMNLLSSIRSAHMVNNGISPEAAEDIRDNIAYPMISKFIYDMTEVATGKYNGKTKENFKYLCRDFVFHFLSDSLKLFR